MAFVHFHNQWGVNQSTQKKREKKGTKCKDSHTRRQVKLQEDEPQGEHQVFEPLPRSISNNEKGTPPKRKPNLNGPSPTTITHLKIKTTYTLCNVNNTLCL